MRKARNCQSYSIIFYTFKLVSFLIKYKYTYVAIQSSFWGDFVQLGCLLGQGLGLGLDNYNLLHLLYDGTDTLIQPNIVVQLSPEAIQGRRRANNI